jgi:beta-xylosidase
MLYEGTRGPGPGDAGDSQYGLGLARSLTDRIDGPWETYSGNPILVDPPGNIGLGHADLVVIGGQTILYTALERDKRSRLALVWKQDLGADRRP